MPDYPAHLSVDYPERLSRGLVLVKWWLLAIPHFLIIALFTGGVAYGVGGAGDKTWISISLLGVLVLVAGVVLLFTGRYPQQVFDLVLGINRWVLRVAGYVSLMTDEYPPFRLDMGGHEPHAAVLPPVDPAAGIASPGHAPVRTSRRTRHPWRPRRPERLDGRPRRLRGGRLPARAHGPRVRRRRRHPGPDRRHRA